MRALGIKSFFALLSFGLFLAAAQPAHAIPTMYPKLRDHEIRVGLQANHYLTPLGETNADNGTGNLGLIAGVRGVGNKGNFQFAVEGESLFGLRRAHYRYLDIGEIYAGFEDKAAPERFSLYLGRKRYAWSTLDSYWSMGMFQPRFRWDYLNERENGLLGLFTGFKNSWLDVNAYYSPIYIPEQGAPFDIANGNCKSASPWFPCPATTVRAFNQPTPVRYSLNVPPIKELILHGGGGVNARFGKENGPFARLAYAYKPMNQFLLSFEGRITTYDAYDVPAVIRPRVLYHDIYSVDVGYNHPRQSLVGSWIGERPHRDETPVTWNTQEASNLSLWGITAKAQPFDRARFTRFEFSYLHRDGGIAPDRGQFTTPGVYYFEPRFAFANAFSFAAFTPIFDEWARRFLFSTKFIVDTGNDGNILVTDFYYSPFASFFFNFGLDMLGSKSSSPVDFIARYQRNDRLRGGVAYVF